MKLLLLALPFVAASMIGTAHAHPTKATKTEMAGGLTGQRDHLQRVLHVKRTGMAYVIRHRNLYDGHAGDVYWHLYREARRASRRLAKVQNRLNLFYGTGGSYGSVAGIVCRLNWSPFSCGQVMQVVNCETGGTYSTGTTTGQFQGIFQMGSSERATYGHGSTVWAQALAAHRYFVASGRDFSPWQCSPHGGLQW